MSKYLLVFVNHNNVCFWFSEKPMTYTDSYVIVDSLKEEEEDETSIEKVKKRKSSLTLSHGAYAGIGCAFLFLGVITFLTIVGIRKR